VIAAVISIIPIIGTFALLGWSIEIGRRVINGDKEVLPDWSDFGGLLTLGFKGGLAALVFSIPLIVVWFPLGIFSGLVGTADLDAAETLITLVSFCVICLTFTYSIALLLALPASYGRLAATDGLGESLNFRELWNIVSNAPGAYLIVLLGYLVASTIASLGIILCVVGVFLTTAYSLAVEGHLLGQAYLEGTADA
jgi:hypothetical protein